MPSHHWPDPKTLGPIALLALLDERPGNLEQMRPYEDEMRRRLRALAANRDKPAFDEEGRT